MSLSVVCVLGLPLAVSLAIPVRTDGVGEPTLVATTPAHLLTPPSHTLGVTSHVAAYTLPDTTRRSVSSDTTRRPALVPDITSVADDEDKPTRKTALLTVLAVAVLTISTLLLYNVRSR